MSPLILTALPLLLVAITLVPGAARRLPAVAAGLMAAQAGVALAACLPMLRGESPPPRGAEFALDGLGAVFTLITTGVAAAAMLHAAFLFPAESRRHAEADRRGADRRMSLYYALTALFLISMYGVLTAQNLGYLWIAMEATTLCSAPLVYFHRTRNALEATWKYLVLCSVGIAFALFGTVVLYAASQGPDGGTLLVAELRERAAALDPRLLRLGFIFCLLGYGTKAGLFPLHNWLPDAHSEAPAPASAMLSGSLLNCALVAVWRISQVMTGAGQEEMVRRLLVPAGAVTVLAAGLMLVRQHDLKRMWAYSSVEHTGLMALAIGIGSGPVFLLHAANHSLVKTALFLLSGNVLHHYGTKSLSGLTGLLKEAPAWAILLAAGAFAVAGSPPFGTFLSEWLLLTETLGAGEIPAALFVLAGLTIAFVSITVHVGRVLFGGPLSLPREGSGAAAPGWSLAPTLLLGLSLAGGLALGPGVLQALAVWAGGR